MRSSGLTTVGTALPDVPLLSRPEAVVPILSPVQRAQFRVLGHAVNSFVSIVHVEIVETTQLPYSTLTVNLPTVSLSRPLLPSLRAPDPENSLKLQEHSWGPLKSEPAPTSVPIHEVQHLMREWEAESLVPLLQ